GRDHVARVGDPAKRHQRRFVHQQPHPRRGQHRRHRQHAEVDDRGQVQPQAVVGLLDRRPPELGRVGDADQREQQHQAAERPTPPDEHQAPDLRSICNHEAEQAVPHLPEPGRSDGELQPV
ncbi:MAG: hypothetical protein AVDCRST_MAG64-3127, partial [uncultured Phycisphaerae bacterium]